ncbi:MAG: hypothetical protein ABIZ80_13520, partial [Bryobacteraceae bacterium]
MKSAPAQGPRSVLACLAACAALFCTDALLFRTGLYPYILEAESSTGQFEFFLRRELRVQAQHSANLVITVGDSRFAYLPRQANELKAASGLVFRNAGTAGSDPRIWYYMLRDLDPDANRYRALVLGVDSYDEEEEGSDQENDPRALHYAIFRLRLSDLFDFPGSHTLPARRWAAYRGALLKGFVLQRDIHELLSQPERRIHSASEWDKHGEEWTYNFQEDERSLAGLQIDWAKREATFPPHADAVQRDTVTNVLLHPDWQPSGKLARFRREWLGRIVDRYRQSPTKVIFVRLARGPIPRPEPPTPKAR